MVVGSSEVVLDPLTQLPFSSQPLGQQVTPPKRSSQQLSSGLQQVPPPALPMQQDCSSSQQYSLTSLMQQTPVGGWQQPLAH